MSAGDRPTKARHRSTGDDVVRALAIKGYVTADMLAPALGVSEDDARDLLDRLVADGIAKESGGMFSLTDDGKALGAEMLRPTARPGVPTDAAAALDGFLSLDGRMKTIVTAWQMKEVDGEQVLNDHGDADYDAGGPRRAGGAARRRIGLARAAASRACRVCRPTPSGSMPPQRLPPRATAMYIASPRVDSYHGVWFELHEDLIRLAGKTREEEVAAGRA